MRVPDDLLATPLFFKVQSRFRERLVHTGMINKHNNVTKEELKCGDTTIKKCPVGWKALVLGELINLNSS